MIFRDFQEKTLSVRQIWFDVKKNFKNDEPKYFEIGS